MQGVGWRLGGRVRSYESGSGSGLESELELGSSVSVPRAGGCKVQGGGGGCKEPASPGCAISPMALFGLPSNGSFMMPTTFSCVLYAMYLAVPIVSQ